jgi:hypothetical protein
MALMIFDEAFIERARYFLSYAYRGSPVSGLTGVKLLMDRFQLPGNDASMLFQRIPERN